MKSTTLKTLVISSLFVVGSIHLSACAQNNSEANSKDSSKPSISTQSDNNSQAGSEKNVLSDLQLLIKDKSCQQSTQCKAVAIGHRACGGPESYEVYSTLTSDESQVKQLAEQYEAQRRLENKNSGMASICQFIPEPQTSCRSGQCVLLEQSLNIQ